MCRGGHDDKEEEEEGIGREGRKKENGDSLERAQTREDQEVSNKRWKELVESQAEEEEEGVRQGRGAKHEEEVQAETTDKRRSRGQQ